MGADEVGGCALEDDPAAVVAGAGPRSMIQSACAMTDRDGARLAFEPDPPERLVEIGADGERFEIGPVRVWDPPRRLVFGWRQAGFAEPPDSSGWPTSSGPTNGPRGLRASSATPIGPGALRPPRWGVHSRRRTSKATSRRSTSYFTTANGLSADAIDCLGSAVLLDYLAAIRRSTNHLRDCTTR